MGKGNNKYNTPSICLPLDISPLESHLKVNAEIRSVEVERMQQRLKDAGYDIKVDGYFGNETLAIVNAFKDKYGIVNTGSNAGVVDNQTWLYLFGNLSGELKLNPKEYSEQVRIAQIRLKDKGYDVDITGYFDEKMQKAVNKFKENNKLGNTGKWEGVIGPQTWGMLFSIESIGVIKSNIESKQNLCVQIAQKGFIDENILNNEINKYVKFVFTDSSGKKSKDLQIYYEWGGKMSLEQLNQKMINLDLKADDPKLQAKITDFAKDKNIMLGIDCSGFVMRVIDKATNGKASEYYRNNISDLKNVKDVIEYGVSAQNMTSLKYSTKITKLSDVKPGDFICFNDGKHIGVIYKVDGDLIYYAHSSGSKGPHLATIKVGESGKNGLDLNKNATFNDWDEEYSKIIKGLYNYICRPKYLTEITPQKDIKPINEPINKQAQQNENSVTLSYAQKIAKEITSGFEGGMYAVAGNFDGAGLSIGYLQYNLGSGSLQPLLERMANGKDTEKEFESIFNFDVQFDGTTKKGYEVVRDILKKTKAEQVKWGSDISMPGNSYYLVEPWKTAFAKLARSDSFLNIQDTSPVTIGYYDKATKIMNDLGLKTVRIYALAFDISVNNGSISNSEKYRSWDLIEKALEGKGPLANPDDTRFNTKGVDPNSSDYAKKVTDRKVVTDLVKHLENVTDQNLRKCYIAAAAAALQKGCVRDKKGNWICYSWDSWTRKVAILDGAGTVHGSVFSNTKLTDDNICN